MAKIDNHDIIESIRRLSARKGVPPTYREIANDLNAQVSLIHRRLHHLREAGLVTFQDQLSRTVRVLEPQ